MIAVPPRASGARELRRAVLAAWLVPLGVALAWGALILLVHRDSPRTLVSAHGLLHAAIAESFADPATRPPLATPPENPLYAGTPLPYYYFFHAVGADVARLFGIDVIHAFELLIVVAAVAAVLLGFALQRILWRLPRAALAGGTAFALLFFAGTNPQAPLVLLARWWKDGAAALEDRGQYLWGLVHPMNGAMRIGDYWGALGPLSTYFFNVTARPLALASLVGVVFLLAISLSLTERRRVMSWIGLMLAAALTALWSPLLGLAAAGALGAGLLLDAWRHESRSAFKRQLRRIEPARRDPATLAKLDGLRRRLLRAELLAAAALLGGVALAWPWWRHLVGAAGGGFELRFNAKRALGVVASCWLLALLAASQPRWVLADAFPVMRVLKVAGLLLALPTTFVALPVGNEDNFLHAALVCWAVVAAGAAVPDPTREVECEPGGG